MGTGHIPLFRALTLTGAALSLLLLALMVVSGGRQDEWAKHQEAFRDSLLARAASSADLDAASSFEPVIRQVSSGMDQRVDRCMTCHVGTVVPGPADLPRPLAGHSGAYLADHVVERFGCTLCHGGDGRDISIQPPCTVSSSGADRRESLRYIESSCGRCHGTVFDARFVREAPVLERGRRLLTRRGCLGCHRLRTVGAALGPDLSEQGHSTLSHYDFRHVRGMRSVPTWLREHFRAPARISPGSMMPPVTGPEDDLDALITLMLSLHPVDLPAALYALEHIAEQRGIRPVLDGREAFALLCRACHGEAGEGTPYDSARVGAPALAGTGFQAVASDEFLWFTLLEGRGPRLMSSWRPVFSSLRKEELAGLLHYVREWKAAVRPWSVVLRSGGSAVHGDSVFDASCAACHGVSREGGIGPGLAEPGFLRIATETFLYRTIAVGRRNTAMPSWSQLSAHELHSLVLSLRRGAPPAHGDGGYVAKGDSAEGGRVFAASCARCHGVHGEGGIGPAILNPDFLAAAQDGFLVRTILEGRAHTPMFGWSRAGARLREADLGHLITYMRSAAAGAPTRIHPGAVLGRPERGAGLFRQHCADCHGSVGQGVRAPALHNQEFLNAASNGFLVATVTLGRPGTAMPAWGRSRGERGGLGQQDRLDIVAHVRVWHSVSIPLPQLVELPADADHLTTPAR